MAGLLDLLFNNPDPEVKAGLLSLGSGLMQGGPGQGAKDYSNYMQAAPDIAMKRKMAIEELAMKQLAEKRAQGDYEMQQDFYKRLGIGGPQSAPSQGAGLSPSVMSSLPSEFQTPTVASMGPQAQAQQGDGSTFMGVPKVAIAADLAFKKGAGIGDMLYKQGTPNWQNVNGNMVNTNAPGFQGGLQDGIQTSANGQTSQIKIVNGKPVISAPEGSVQTALSFKSGEQVPVDLPDGRKATFTPGEWSDYTSNGTIPARYGGGPKAAFQPPKNIGDARVTPELAAAVAADANPNGPAPTLIMNGRGKTFGWKPDGESPAKPVFGLSQSPEDAAALKTKTEASGKINDSWFKTSHEPVQAAGQAAQGMIESTIVARNALKDMGGGGWGTEAKASGAAVLSALGVAPKSAEFFASNAQVFQGKAMERLWTTLNAAKGPQTEGDAGRASQTWAQLKNTPRANEFILDMAQAQAERDKAKATFYNNALPIAQKNGDMSEIDRQWNKRMPSIFDMPTMQKWNKK